MVGRGWDGEDGGRERAEESLRHKILTFGYQSIT